MRYDSSSTPAPPDPNAPQTRRSHDHPEGSRYASAAPCSAQPHDRDRRSHRAVFQDSCGGLGPAGWASRRWAWLCSSPRRRRGRLRWGCLPRCLARESGGAFHG
jgi:hypothetical protein